MRFLHPSTAVTKRSCVHSRKYLREHINEHAEECACEPAHGKRVRRVHGFTLVEVLVAMAILAIGVSALVSASGASAIRSKVLSDREFGRWVAANHLNTIQAMPVSPDVGTTNTEVEMMNRTWHVRTRTKKEDLDLLRMDIEVRLTKEAEGYIYSVTGFAGSPKHRF